jgi:hypothetical protein
MVHITLDTLHCIRNFSFSKKKQTPKKRHFYLHKFIRVFINANEYLN